MGCSNVLRRRWRKKRHTERSGNPGSEFVLYVLLHLLSLYGLFSMFRHVVCMFGPCNPAQALTLNIGLAHALEPEAYRAQGHAHRRSQMHGVRVIHVERFYLFVCPVTRDNSKNNWIYVFPSTIVDRTTKPQTVILPFLNKIPKRTIVRRHAYCNMRAYSLRQTIDHFNFWGPGLHSTRWID